MLNEIGSDLAKFRHLLMLQVIVTGHAPRTYDAFVHEAEVLASWSRLGSGLKWCILPCETQFVIEILQYQSIFSSAACTTWLRISPLSWVPCINTPIIGEWWQKMLLSGKMDSSLDDALAEITPSDVLEAMSVDQQRAALIKAPHVMQEQDPNLYHILSYTEI
jgi:hypothetical protein